MKPKQRIRFCSFEREEKERKKAWKPVWKVVHQSATLLSLHLTAHYVNNVSVSSGLILLTAWILWTSNVRVEREREREKERERFWMIGEIYFWVSFMVGSLRRWSTQNFNESRFSASLSLNVGWAEASFRFQKRREVPIVAPPPHFLSFLLDAAPPFVLGNRNEKVFV